MPLPLSRKIQNAIFVSLYIYSNLLYVIYKSKYNQKKEKGV